MTLQPGCRFVVAPHFHLPADWPRRLRVGVGVEEADGCFFPRPLWRPPTAEELAVLVPSPAGPKAPEDPEACVCLFQLPGHLWGEWWKLLERGMGDLGGGRLPHLDVFVNQLAEFLAFKDLPLPEGARCDVVVSRPGQRSVPWGREASPPGGLRGHPDAGAAWPLEDPPGVPRLWGGINLGEADTSVVLINLPYRQLAAALRDRVPDQPAPTAVGDLVGRFLRSWSDYPPTRLILGPGEGYRLPRSGLILDGYPGDKQEPDVLLLIFQDP
jgi:hypothetical protein